MANSDSKSPYVTSGDIAETLGRDAGQVRHILASRRDIQPVARAGLVRLYPLAAIERVRQEIEAIDARRERAVPP